MKFIFCHIENFGRLRDFDYSFSDGLNTILHENGWGKSTFAAFLCAMLYGLPTARKKNPAENERLKFRPWQGGVYGGTLIFEAAGRSYEISRIFGTRESEDVFELRDVETNLPSFDYSAKTGEELFHLDRDSFLHTVFTGQQDCVTSATDDVNALVAALEEEAGDMSAFSAAMKRLTDAANRLSPQRQTGTVAWRAGEISRLERETSGGEALPGLIREREEALRKAAAEEAVWNERLLKLEEEIEQARREEDERQRDRKAAEADAAARGMREHLLEQVEGRRRDVLAAAAAFPGRVPTRREVDQYLDLCRQMDRLEEQMQSGQLSAREQKRLTELEDRFPEDMPVQGQPRLTELEERFRDKRSLQGQPPSRGEAFSAEQKPVKKKKREEPFPSPGGHRRTAGAEKAACIAGAVIGLVLIAAGLALGLVYKARIGAGFAAAGILAVVSSAGVYIGRLYPAGRGTDASGRETDSLRKEKASSENRSSSAEEALLREYTYLLKKEQRLETIHARWTELRRPVLKFLGETEKGDVSPDEDLYTRLLALRDAADDYEDALKLLQEAQAQLSSLEKTLPAQDLLEPETPLPEIPVHRILALQQARADALTGLADCRKKAAENRRILEELQAQQEDQAENLRYLQDLRTRQAADAVRYRQITMAGKLLQKAKETMSARYADPIRERFAHYWERITGHSAAGVYVDADSHVTVEEAGKQREAALLSEGYRDLTGICLRAALADAMYPEGRSERPPLILDDPFANLDDEKTQRALGFLRELSEKYQILYFTCSLSRTL